MGVVVVVLLLLQHGMSTCNVLLKNYSYSPSIPQRPVVISGLLGRKPTDYISHKQQLAANTICWTSSYFPSFTVSLAICRPSGCTVPSAVVSVFIVVVIVVGVCNHSQMRTSKCTCLISV